MEQKLKIDAIGDQCPLPVVKAKKALDTAMSGMILEVAVDNEIAVQNVLKLAKNQQCECHSEKRSDKHVVVTIVAGAQAHGTVANKQEVPEICQPDIRNQSVVVVASSKMGEGNEELGTVLMKGFLYAVSQLDTLPEKILFYNSGVMLTTKGSDSLEDLKSMEAQGVEILSCGTCLNYYNCSDKLMVGEVTNMYSIVEAMSAASKIIKP